MSRPAILCIVTVMATFAVYAGILIYRSSVLLENQRWFCLLDDAMISMRYARNVANGLGLVWNAGDRVEGITNPGWTLVMALVHLFEINRSWTSLYIQVISAFCLLLNILIVGHLSWTISRGSLIVMICAAAMTAFYYPLNYFSLYGMETGIVALLLTAAVSLYVHQVQRNKFPWISYAILGLSTLVRIDVAISLLLVGFYGICTSTAPGSRRRHALWLTGTLIVFIGGQTLARIWYYGYPFPNTYYLKMTGFPVLQRMARGLLVTVITLWYLLWPVALAWVIVLALLIKHRGKLRNSNLRFPIGLMAVLPGLIFLGQACYSVYVGGDAWEEDIFCNRYMVVAIPLLAATWSLLIIAGFRVILTLLDVHKRDAMPALGVMVLLALVAINYKSCRWQVLQESLFLVRPAIQIDNYNAVKVAQLLSSSSTDAKISSDWAGAIPYFLDRYAIDPLGKCDVYIARLPVTQDQWGSRVWEKAFYPGHMKWDFYYVWKTYQPDYMVFRWGRLALEFLKVLKSEYVLVDDDLDQVMIFRRLQAVD